jgi:hypothetical protein
MDLRRMMVTLQDRGIKNTSIMGIPFAILLSSCGTNMQPSEIREPSNTAFDTILSSTKGDARKELTSFLASAPIKNKIDNVILIDGTQSLGSLSLGDSPNTYSNLPNVSLNPIELSSRKTDNSVRELNLLKCSDAAINRTGFWSRRNARGYLGFSGDVKLPSSVLLTRSSNTAYIYGSASGGTDGVEIGFQYSTTNNNWSAYIGINGSYQNATNKNGTTYDSQGYLIPLLKYSPSQTVSYQIAVFKNQNDPQVFYVSAIFGSTAVGYKISAANASQVYGLAGLNPSNYRNIAFGSVAAIAQPPISYGADNSKLTGYKISSLKLFTPNPTLYPSTTTTWLKALDNDDCVSDQSRVTASHPIETTNVTDINLVK